MQSILRVVVVLLISTVGGLAVADQESPKRAVYKTPAELLAAYKHATETANWRLLFSLRTTAHQDDDLLMFVLYGGVAIEESDKLKSILTKHGIDWGRLNTKWNGPLTQERYNSLRDGEMDEIEQYTTDYISSHVKDKAGLYEDVMNYAETWGHKVTKMRLAMQDGPFARVRSTTTHWCLVTVSGTGIRPHKKADKISGHEQLFLRQIDGNWHLALSTETMGLDDPFGLDADIPRFSITIDGEFDDWKNFKTGWQETGGVGPGTFTREIDVKQFYYRNDDQWLYLFFTCQPSVAERGQKMNHMSGSFAYLYVDSDASADTGATKLDFANRAAMLGTDVKIELSIISQFEIAPDGKRTRLSPMSCSVSWWNEGKGAFVFREVARGFSLDNPRVADGKDGVELAVSLAELGRVKGDTFDFICIEAAHPEPEYANRISITLD